MGEVEKHGSRKEGEEEDAGQPWGGGGGWKGRRGEDLGC
jgi:hypothetical protein